MVFRLCLILIGSLIFGGCSTTYVYQAKLKALDSSNTEKEHVIYWTKTHRSFWFDTVAGSITLLTGCSANAVQFDEQENGIVFRKRPGDEFIVQKSTAFCGEVLGVNHIKDIEVGNLRLAVYCSPTKDEWTISNDEYLRAQSEPYVFPVFRKQGRDVPKRPSCNQK